MYAIYNLLLYLLTIICSPLLIAVLLTQKRYRSGFFQKFGFISWETIRRIMTSRPIWVHAVSVGEVLTTIPLIRALNKIFPDTPIILSTATETGKHTAQQNLHNHAHVIFFPFDYPLVSSLFVSRINPLAFIALETELWPNFLRALTHRAIPAVIISGRISSRSFRTYRRCAFFFRQVLENIDCFCMQTPADAQRIIAMGADAQRVRVAGNIKFDLPIPVLQPHDTELLYTSLNLAKGQNIFIAGSTHRGEEEIILDVFQVLQEDVPDLTLILAPRHPERFSEVAALIQERGLPYVRKTAIADSATAEPGHVILLDTIGELARLYSIGTVIFIGGSLVPIGGHNVLEPAVYKKPVLFGPHMNNFLEIARALCATHAAIQIQGRDDLILHTRELFNNAELRKKLGEQAFQVVAENTGALQKSLEAIQPIIEKQRA